MNPQSARSSTVSLDDQITWVEANSLRAIVTDHMRDARKDMLLAEAEGAPSVAAYRKRYEDACQLESKVRALFYRLSDRRG